MPTSSSAFSPSQYSGLRMFGYVMHKRLSVNARMCGAGQHNQILRAVIIAYAVDVVRMLRGLQIATKRLLRNKAMLRNVPITIRSRVLWLVNVDIAALVLVATTLPSWVIRATVAKVVMFSVMAFNKGFGMALEPSQFAECAVSNVRAAPATAFTDTARYLFGTGMVFSGHSLTSLVRAYHTWKGVAIT
jgi:hypothetical protein